MKADSNYFVWYIALQRRSSRKLIYSSTTLQMTEAEEDTRSLPAVAIHTVILALSTIFALLGNSLVCLAFDRNRRLRTITNVSVLSLAVADIMASIFVLLFSTVASGYRAWPFKSDFCQFNGFISYLWGAMSINILALTAVNRYICIIKPHLYPTLFTRKKTLFSILSVLLLTLTACLTATLATPILFQWYPLDLAFKVTGLEVQVDVSKSSVGFVGLALSLIIFCYGSVYRTIKRHNSVVNPSLQDITNQAAHTKFRHLGFFSPQLLHLSFPGFPLQLCGEVRSPLPSYWLPISTLFAAFSSWINPVIYGVMNRAMKKEFLKLLRCRSKT